MYKLAWSALFVVACAVAVGCNNDKPNASSGGSGTTGTTPPSTGPTDAGSDGAVQTCPPPPYSCDLPDAGTPQTKDGAGGPKGGTSPGTSAGICNSDQVMFSPQSLKVSSPTGAFATSWNAATGNAGLGAWTIRLFDFDSASASDYRVRVGGASALKPSGLGITEDGAELAVTVNGASVAVAATKATFHVAFTRRSNNAGDLEVDGFAMTATLDPGCTSLTNVTATLYIPSSQAGVSLSEGGPTIGSQLGSATGNVGGLGFSGWAVTVSAFDVQVVQ